MRFVVLGLLLSVGCYESIRIEPREGGVDRDGGTDAASDLPLFFDAPPDRRVDAPDRPDIGTDGPVDIGTDGPIEIGADVPVDVPPDIPLCLPERCPPPPAPTCADDRTLRVFGEAFCAEDASCGYPEEDFTCASSCEAGACVEVCGEWVTDVLADGGEVGGTTSLALGRRDVFIAYGEGRSNETRVARFFDGVFGLERVGNPPTLAALAGLSVSPADELFVVFSPPRSAGLRVSERSAMGSWRNSVVPDVTGRVESSQFLDARGNLHVVHPIRVGMFETPEAGYLVREGGEWRRIDLFDASFGGRNSIVADARGNRIFAAVNVTMGVAGSQDALASREAGGGWTIQRLDGPAGTLNAIATQGDTVYLADFVEDQLRLRTIRTTIGGPGSVEETLVPFGGTTATQIDMAAGEGFGDLVFSFRETTERQLWFGRRDADGGDDEWSFEVVDDALGSGEDSSIAVGLGGIHISHQSDTLVRERQLRYTRFIACE
ncbi:MAG: hypothetical protein AAF645_08290 [Myxococcota bacterium]